MGVCDLSWDPSGTYLLSCSLDQTTRCFIPTLKGGYAEVARPQVHGHDFNCIVSISKFLYVSGAEEKILRVFQAPLLFAKSLCAISGLLLEETFPDTSFLAESGAVVPALGLSNKKMEGSSGLPFIEDQEENGDIFIAPDVLTEIPTEDHLMQSTLWPEVHKLYGHGFEIFTVACNHAGTQIASACKASQSEHAIILLWDTKFWKKVASLTAHHLTVTQIEFSKNDHMLASVSRDRTFSIFVRGTESAFDWSLLYRSNGRNDVHSRIIWSCSWSGDDKYLATCSRDKKLAIWRVNENERLVSLKLSISRDASVTAIDFCSSWKEDGYLIAVGLETGTIEIFQFRGDDLRPLICLDQSIAHSQTVKRLRFRPQAGPWHPSLLENDVYDLASAGLDNAVKVYRLKFKRCS